MKLIDLESDKDYILDGKYAVMAKDKCPKSGVLVRCKDCIHYDEHNRWQCDRFGKSVNTDDYCSYGEKA